MIDSIINLNYKMQGFIQEITLIFAYHFRSGDRVSVAAVAEYYKDYVEKMGLSKNFLNRAIVTRVRKVSCSSLRFVCLNTSMVNANFHFG